MPCGPTPASSRGSPFHSLGGTVMALCRASVVGAICVIMICTQRTNAEPVSKWELADALPPFTPSTCVPPNQRERSLFDLAASAIEQGDQEIANWLEIGAQKYLAKHQFRTEGGRRVAICTPD